ncbi:MAG: FxsA family protein [Azospirillaceae bacterium]
MPFVLLALIAIPLLEIAVFIWIGGIIGIGWTLAGILITAVLGSLLIRHQGVRVLAEARAQAADHRPPVKPIFDGVCLLVAGALLLTPGFVTDTIGFMLLVPPLRDVLGRYIWRWLERSGRVSVTIDGRRGHDGPQQPTGHTPDDEGPPPAAPGTPAIGQSRWGRGRR